jgi:hypothetical protein
MRVDGKLTERRDEGSVNGIEGTPKTGDELRFLGRKPVTSDFGGSSAMLDAEEVRGSNPLAPTQEAQVSTTFSGRLTASQGLQAAGFNWSGGRA